MASCAINRWEKGTVVLVHRGDSYYLPEARKYIMADAGSPSIQFISYDDSAGHGLVRVFNRGRHQTYYPKIYKYEDFLINYQGII